jgi:alanine dehydrogenase
MEAKEYGYDTLATETVVWTYLQAFANNKRTAPRGKPWSICPIISCTVKQSDCRSPLVAPFDSLVSVDPSSYSLQISQT